jgi:hypothetical protein
MGFIDPTFGRPFINFQQVGSFNQPVVFPADGPFDGVLYQLPCVSAPWIRLILGCLTQLVNPSTWDSSNDAITLAAVQTAQELLGAIGDSVNVPCCDITMQLTEECMLQFSTDGGVHWTNVSNWDTNFCPCVSGCTIPPVPANPGNNPIQQHACNIAGFLASEIVQKTMVAVESYVGTTDQEFQFASDLATALLWAFPISRAFINAAYDWYHNVVGQLLSQVTTAATDPTLWSDVTCAIYNAIHLDGYVTAGNFAAVHTNLASLSYTYSWVAPAIAAFWNDLGLQNIQYLQSIGAVDDVDCTNCGAWCNQEDLSMGVGAWSPYVAGHGTYVSGTGWETTYIPAAGRGVMQLAAGPATARTVTGVNIYISSPTANTLSPGSRQFGLLHGGSTVFVQTLADTSFSPFSKIAIPISAIVADEYVLNWTSDGTTPAIFQAFQDMGNPPAPGLLNPCTFP